MPRRYGNNFNRVIVRKVGVYFEITHPDFRIQGTNREVMLKLADLWDGEKVDQETRTRLAAKSKPRKRRSHVHVGPAEDMQ